jgi:hypothetical protein
MIDEMRFYQSRYSIIVIDNQMAKKITIGMEIDAGISRNAETTNLAWIFGLLTGQPDTAPL